MNALQQLISKLSRGSSLSGDDLFALLLVVTMVASLSHLLTMLATRWGDRNIAVKSLLASILIHSVCFLGLEVFEPTSARRAKADVPRPPLPVAVTDVLVEGQDDVPLAESGNTPYAKADRPTQPDIDLQRFEGKSRELAPSETPARTPDELESLTTTAQDVTQFEPREMTELAVPTDAGLEGPKQPAAEDPVADLKTTFEKNAADVFTLDATRTLPQAGRPDEKRRVDDPTALLAAPELKFDAPTRDIAMSLATDSDTVIELPLPPVAEGPGDVIERGAAPTVAPESSDGGTLTAETRKPRNGAASSFQARLPRPSRSVPDRDPAMRSSRNTPDRAQTPTPLSDSYDDVRIGDLAPDFSESLQSAAPLTEADLPTIQRRDNPPATYQLRNVEVRRDAAERFGGTRESENAVERSLRWLVANQSADGHWDADEHGAGTEQSDKFDDAVYPGRNADTGLTALVMLSFLGAGYTHENGGHCFEVDRALDWLISQQGDDGNLCGKADYNGRMYCHAMATYSLAEAYGMQTESFLGPIVDPDLVLAPREIAEIAAAQTAAAVTAQCTLVLLVSEQTRRRMETNQFVYSLRRVDDIRLRSALARAVAFTIGQQDPTSGGWRYKLLQEGDVSMFGWQLMSLKSAEIAGVSVPARVRERMNTFLNTVRQGQHGGLFGYRRNVVTAGVSSVKVSPTMTAEALFCQQMLGYPRDSASNRESVTYLMKNTPRLSELNYYYWYYGTLAMYQHGGRPWQDWNAVVRDTLISQQVTTGPTAGSWEPNDEWGRYGGRLYSTALATLTLEVYYRLLPLYRMNDKPEPK